MKLLKGFRDILERSLTPSYTACKIPEKLLLFGETRICVKPRKLRSSKVKKATPNKLKRIKIKINNKIKLNTLNFTDSRPFLDQKP